MQILFHPVFLSHDTGNHPENKQRLLAFKTIPDSAFPSGEQFLSLVHTAEHRAFVKSYCTESKFLDPDTPTSPESYEAACMAVGATIAASISGDFALVRPPGHHAYTNHSAGFCLFNNIAIATQKLVSEGKKVLILDIDGHVGDGTEDFFYSSDAVLYWSLHQYPAYPHKGSADEIGEGNGAGYTINVPLPPQSGDDVYKKSLEAILPYALAFRPDIVAVSAGFDGHWQDPLLQLHLSTKLYYEIGVFLKTHFSTVFATLEGGYNPDVLPQCVENFIAGYNGDPIPYPSESNESPILVLETVEQTLSLLREKLKPYWKL